MDCVLKAINTFFLVFIKKGIEVVEKHLSREHKDSIFIVIVENTIIRVIDT